MGNLNDDLVYLEHTKKEITTAIRQLKKLTNIGLNEDIKSLIDKLTAKKDEIDANLNSLYAETIQIVEAENNIFDE